MAVLRELKQVDHQLEWIVHPLLNGSHEPAIYVEMHSLVVPLGTVGVRTRGVDRKLEVHDVGMKARIVGSIAEYLPPQVLNVARERTTRPKPPGQSAEDWWHPANEQVNLPSRCSLRGLGDHAPSRSGRVSRVDG